MKKKPHIHWNLWLQLHLESNHFSSATTLPKYQKFTSQITILGTSYKQTPLCKQPSPLVELKV